MKKKKKRESQLVVSGVLSVHPSVVLFSLNNYTRRRRRRSCRWMSRDFLVALKEIPARTAAMESISLTLFSGWPSHAKCHAVLGPPFSFPSVAHIEQRNKRERGCCAFPTLHKMAIVSSTSSFFSVRSVVPSVAWTGHWSMPVSSRRNWHQRPCNSLSDWNVTNKRNLKEKLYFFFVLFCFLSSFRAFDKWTV